jgi:hypothetical protein
MCAHAPGNENSEIREKVLGTRRVKPMLRVWAVLPPLLRFFHRTRASFFLPRA